jgi:hypothetical protein
VVLSEVRLWSKILNFERKWPSAKFTDSGGCLSSSTKSVISRTPLRTRTCGFREKLLNMQESAGSSSSLECVLGRCNFSTGLTRVSSDGRGASCYDGEPLPTLIFVAGLTQVAIPLQAAPTPVTGNACGLRYRFAHLKQPRNPVVPEIVEVQIINA